MQNRNSDDNHPYSLEDSEAKQKRISEVVKGMKKNERDLFSKISRSAILANYDTSTIPVAHIRFNMTSYDYESLIDFFNIVLDRIKLKGFLEMLPL